MMNRTRDWPERMHEAIEAARERPFRWGEHDCALFACGVVLAMTGTDLAGEFRGLYGSGEEAERIVSDSGGLKALCGSVAARFGLAEIPRAYARRGDVVLVPAGPGGSLALAICDGRFALSTQESGLVAVPMASAVKAWRV